MKKIIYFLFAIIIVLIMANCNYPSEIHGKNCLYQEGDLIYLKPDSTLVVITYASNYYYDGYYFDKFGKKQNILYIKEKEIFGKK